MYQREAVYCPNCGEILFSGDTLGRASFKLNHDGTTTARCKKCKTISTMPFILQIVSVDSHFQNTDRLDEL